MKRSSRRRLHFRSVAVWLLVMAIILAPGLSERGFMALVAPPKVQAQTIGTTSYTYDNNGNMLSRTTGGLTDTFTYDAENRLISANVQTGTNPGPVTYTYDDDGMRTGKTAGGVTTSFLLDKNREYPQAVVERTGGTIISYTYGSRLISQTATGFGSRFYLADGHFSTRQLTTSAGSVSDTYTYDGFGGLLASTGLTPNNYQYTGEQFDPNIGLYYLRARYYDQTTGRFSATDPVEGTIFSPLSLHRYLYTNANPVNNIDPSGKFAMVLAALGAIASVIAVIDLIGAAAGYFDALGSVRWFAKKSIAGRTDKFIIRFCPTFQYGFGFGWGTQIATIGEDPDSVKDPMAMRYSLGYHGATPGISASQDAGTGTIKFSSTPAPDIITKKPHSRVDRKLEDFEGQGTYYTGVGISLGVRGGNLINQHVLPEGSSIWLTPSISPKLGGFSFEFAAVQQVDWAAQTAKGNLADFQRKGYGTLDCPSVTK